MSFSASTCVTNLGGIDINSTVKIRTYPGEIQIGGDIILSAMTGVNCPYTINDIPNGTTELQIYVPGTNVCGYIDISDNDLCNTCDLGFNSYTSTTIGNIVVGNLTGSCDNPITDYIINWYGPSETTSPRSTNIAAVSGFGNEFPDYNYNHPLTGTSALPMERGYYIPVIDKVRINGVDFSITGGTGYVLANLDCFDGVPVYVSGYTCDNGTEIGDYSHRVRFTTDGGSKPPQALASSFILSATTNFFAWKFKGEYVPDQLKLTFRGAAYDFEPIILEWWEVGNIQPQPNQTISQNIDTFPKSAVTIDYLTKVTTLTGMTITDDDTIKLEVIPSPTNPSTSWDFYFTCLETFSCDTCLDSYENQTYKISCSTITGVTNSCDITDVRFNIVGCDLSNYRTSDLYKYYDGGGYNQQYGGSYYSENISNRNLLYNNRTYCNYNWEGSNPFGTCSISNNYISFSKTNTGLGSTGVINMNFSGSSALTDLTKFYTQYLWVKNNISFSGSTSNTDYSYYAYTTLRISTVTIDDSCGDGTAYQDYHIHHPTATISTGGTSSLYTLTITMPTITKGIFPTTCEEYCDGLINNYINVVNNSSTGSTNVLNIYNNKGSSYFKVATGRRVYQINESNTGVTQQGYFYRNSNSLKTIPASGSSNTIIPSLSGQVCDYSTYGYLSTYSNIPPIGNGLYNYIKTFYNYRVVLTNPSNVRDFDIYMSPINNFVVSGFPSTILYDLAYSYSGESVVYSNPTYII